MTTNRRPSTSARSAVRHCIRSAHDGSDQDPVDIRRATLTHTVALARLGAALADETRARILLALREEPAVPSDLSRALGVSKQVVSNQLACLRGCGLVEAERKGRHVWYRLAGPDIAPALDDLLRLVLTVDPGCCSDAECRCS